MRPSKLASFNIGAEIQGVSPGLPCRGCPGASHSRFPLGFSWCVRQDVDVVPTFPQQGNMALFHSRH